MDEQSIQETQNLPVPCVGAGIPPQPYHHANKNVLLLIPMVMILIIGIGFFMLTQQKTQDTQSRASLTGVTLALSPANKTATIGETFTLGITMNTDTDTVSAAELHLSYDPTAIEIVIFTTGTPLPIVLTPETHTNGAISVTLGVQPTTPFKGANIVGTWTIKILTAKQSSMSITSDTQVAALGKTTNALVSSTGSTIVGISAPTNTLIPTATSTPTIKPTPTPTISICAPGLTCVGRFSCLSDETLCKQSSTGTILCCKKPTANPTRSPTPTKTPTPTPVNRNWWNFLFNSGKK